MRSSIEKICSFYKERKCARKICIVFVTLTVGPILMVLNLFRQKSQFKNGGSGPLEMKVWGPRPIPPRLRHLWLYLLWYSNLRVKEYRPTPSLVLQSVVGQFTPMW